jgi:hypothetical protein
MLVSSLAHVFEAFGPTVALNMIFLLLRNGLAVCHDFHYMAKASALTFVVVYTPSILIARFVIDSTTALYLAMYAPHFGMIFVFGSRMLKHLRAMDVGAPGPWTDFMTDAQPDSATTASVPVAGDSYTSDSRHHYEAL